MSGKKSSENPKGSQGKVNQDNGRKRKKSRGESSPTTATTATTATMTTLKESTGEKRTQRKEEASKSIEAVKAKKSTTKTTSAGRSYMSAANGSKMKTTETGTKAKSTPMRNPRKKREQMRDGELVVSSKNTWRVSTMLGAGGYGDVYKVTRADDDKAYAMKTEAADDNQRKHRLKLEVEVLEDLRNIKEEDKRHFVTMLDKGKVAGKFKFIVMTLVGPALDDVRKRLVPGGEFSANTVTQIAKQSLEAIRDLHKMGFIHRDIKVRRSSRQICHFQPQNFAIGLNELRSTLFLLDFGICRRYLDRVTGLPREPRKKVRFIGSLKYASRRCHESKEQGRKDDLEVWFYLVFDSYDSKDGLPWKKLKDPDRFKKIYKKKVEFIRGAVDKDPKEVMALPWWSKVPREYLDLMKYVVGLERFEQTPDYEMMLKMVENIAGEAVIDVELDWEKSGEEYSEEVTQDS